MERAIPDDLNTKIIAQQLAELAAPKRMADRSAEEPTDPERDWGNF